MHVPMKLSRSIVEQAPAAIIVIDMDGRVTYQNAEAQRLLCFSDAAIVGRNLVQATGQRDAGVASTVLASDQARSADLAAHRQPARPSVRSMARQDGVRVTVSCTEAPLYSGNQQVGTVLFATEITDQKNADEVALQQAEKLTLAIDAAEIGWFDIHLQTQELIWSERVKQHFGLAPDALASLAVFYQILHPDDRERVQQTLTQAQADMQREDGRCQIQFRTVSPIDGETRWIAARTQAFYDANGKPVRLVGTTADITERTLAEMQLREAAQHDALTGLPNRALLFEYCDYLLAQATRAEADSAVLFIDLDRFKAINDLYGHEIGDKVLQEVARRLQACTRREDIVSRLGGDEFIIVLPRIQTGEDPETVAQHILEAIVQPIRVGSLELALSSSIGISLFRKHASDLDGLIRCADLAMYSAKQSGRNTFRMFTPGHDERASDRLQLEIHIKHQLESDAMVLFYQPIVDVKSGHLIGAEALIRMHAEDGKLLNPDQFIPVAESAGLIGKLGHWTSAEACRQNQAWRKAGLPPFSMAINVSAIEFRQRSFISHLAGVLEQTGMDPGCLQIELTESAVMDNVPEAIAILEKLRAMGVKIALDDFGTGYSSFSNLRKLPLDKLKIDQSFISHIDSDEFNQSISEAIIGLGRSMNLKIVGEGIESDLAMDYLRDHGCDQAQGFLFSAPLPALEFESWCKDHVQRFH